MYLVKIPKRPPEYEQDWYLFFEEDPKVDGCPYDVEEDIVYVQLESEDFAWKDGVPTAFYPVLARSKSDPKLYREIIAREKVPETFEIIEDAGPTPPYSRWYIYKSQPAGLNRDDD